MHVYSPVFQGQLIEKIIRSITFIVWVLGRIEKNARKGKKTREGGGAKRPPPSLVKVNSSYNRLISVDLIIRFVHTFSWE